MKIVLPLDRLAAMWVWPGQVSPELVRFLGLVDVAGGIGVLLPRLLKLQPRLTLLAALGCALLQIAAIIFHLSRGEGAVTPLNFLLLAFSGFVLWSYTTRKLRSH